MGGYDPAVGILYSTWFVVLMISRPSENSAKVWLSICASFEFSPMLGNGEVLRTVEIRVRDLLDNAHRRKHYILCTSEKCAEEKSVITFSPTKGKTVSPCSSLHITMEQRPLHELAVAMDHDHDVSRMTLQTLSSADRSSQLRTTGKRLQTLRS